MKMKRGSQLDLIMNHQQAKEFVQKNGYDEFIREVDNEFKYGLGCASTYWENDSNYICKMKGKKGDVIIGWRDEDDI